MISNSYPGGQCNVITWPIIQWKNLSHLSGSGMTPIKLGGHIVFGFKGSSTFIEGLVISLGFSVDIGTSEV